MPYLTLPEGPAKGFHQQVTKTQVMQTSFQLSNQQLSVSTLSTCRSMEGWLISAPGLPELHWLLILFSSHKNHLLRSLQAWWLPPHTCRAQ